MSSRSDHAAAAIALSSTIDTPSNAVDNKNLVVVAWNAQNTRRVW